jgi:hypothetical protein
MAKIALDFDGTVCVHQYPSIGRDIGAVPVLKELISNGHQLVLNTMRSGQELEDAVEWFKDNEIPLYGINSTPGQSTWTSSPKVYAHLYIDDAALGISLVRTGRERPYVNWSEVREMLIEEGYIK